MTDLEPLFSLRLRTLRLELRLGRDDEVRALAELAQRGVHPPSEMPFSIPWTDGIGRPSFLEDFVGYHRAQLADWSAADWHLPLLVWHGGELVGEQSVFARDFSGRREISTGSWLGIAHQRQGLGTEMRTAVLELGFARLGALSATSAWLEGNESSRRVSEKLGYLPTGTITVSPRGAEVIAHENRLERARWSPPVHVEIVLPDAALPLLGAVEA
jgi:RimJ/RimL family protein N-acetyltransferase